MRFLLVILALSATAYCLDSTIDTFGTDQQLIVELAFNVSGMYDDPPPCISPLDTECLPVLQSKENPAHSSKLIVTYSFNESFSNGTDADLTGIVLRACYANVSQTDRPWRKDKKVVNPSMSNQCKTIINKLTALPAENGTFTWSLPNNLAPATYYVRAYTVCGNNDGTVIYCSWGQSQGYFVVESWDSVPGWLVATTIPLICLGPTCLALYFGWSVIAKKRNGGK